MDRGINYVDEALEGMKERKSSANKVQVVEVLTTVFAAFSWEMLVSGMLLTVCLPLQSLADESQYRQLINCKEYWSKFDGVPVYAAPDESSEVITKLPAQKRVCVIGEKAEFMILDWTKQALINDRMRESKEQKAKEITYARKVDLHQAQDHDADVWSRTKRQMRRIRQGVVPEDVYGPFRPVIDWLQPPTKCLAGEAICEQVEADLKRQAEAAKEKDGEEKIEGTEP